MTDRRLPIGPFVTQEAYSQEELATFIRIIETAPSAFRLLVENLSEEELAKTYRDDSWNVRQLVHHVADIQFIHYFRMKKAITEPDYKEVTLIDMNVWTLLPDSLLSPIADSLIAFEGITRRYTFFAKTLTEKQLAISYFHPVRKLWFNQKQAIAMSAWHVENHLGHIRWALEG